MTRLEGLIDSAVELRESLAGMLAENEAEQGPDMAHWDNLSRIHIDDCKAMIAEVDAQIQRITRG